MAKRRKQFQSNFSFFNPIIQLILILNGQRSTRLYRSPYKKLKPNNSATIRDKKQFYTKLLRHTFPLITSRLFDNLRATIDLMNEPKLGYSAVSVSCDFVSRNRQWSLSSWHISRHPARHRGWRSHTFSDQADRGGGNNIICRSLFYIYTRIFQEFPTIQVN